MKQLTSYLKKISCCISIIHAEAIKRRETFECNNKLKYVKYSRSSTDIISFDIVLL